MYHALALVATAVLMNQIDGWLVVSAGWLFVAGIVLFRGAYVLALTGITVWGPSRPSAVLRVLLGRAALAIAAAAR